MRQVRKIERTECGSHGNPFMRSLRDDCIARVGGSKDPPYLPAAFSRSAARAALRMLRMALLPSWQAYS